MLESKKIWIKQWVVVMVIAIIFCLPQSSYGDTIQRADDWALNDLYEAEVSEILPLDWQNTLHNTVTSEQIEYMIKGLENKFEQAGLEKEEAISVYPGNTREQVLENYYQALTQYKTQINIGTDMLDYMLNHKIVAGDKEGNINGSKLCTVQEATLFANRILKDIYRQVDAGAKGYLWEVSKGNHKLYLLGTVHIADPVTYPFNHKLNEIIQTVDKVIFEVDFNDQKGKAYLLQKQIYTDGTNLESHIPEDLYGQVITVMKKLGIPEFQAAKYKPWALANAIPSMLASDEEGESNVGTNIPVIDGYVYTKSLLGDKDILELEGYIYQADMFDQMPLELQIDYLKDSLMLKEEQQEEITSSIALMKYWVESFIDGDIEGFQMSYPKDRMLAEENTLTKSLFQKRDKEMTEEIVQYLDTEGKESYLVVVGAGHMIGETGIINRLKELGYQVKPFYTIQ